MQSTRDRNRAWGSALVEAVALPRRGLALAETRIAARNERLLVVLPHANGPLKPHRSSYIFPPIALAPLAGGVLAVLLSFSWAGARPAMATTVVVRADGSGDVPTFQAGVDRLMGTAGTKADLLVVEPGFYDERVLFDFSGGASCRGEIVTVAGPDSTRLRSLAARGDASGSRCEIRGLEVKEAVSLGSAAKAFSWELCRFLSDVESLDHHQQSFERCEFRGSLLLSGGGSISGSRFSGWRASLTLTFGVIVARDCTFEFTPETAVFVTPGDNSRIRFEACLFRSVGAGIVVNPDGWYGLGDGLSIDRCLFQDIDGAAITYHANVDVSGTGLGLDVAHSRFERCGQGIDIRSERRIDLSMTADTLTSMKGNGIEVSALLSCSMDSLFVRNGGGHGIVLSWPGFATFPLTLSRSVIEGNAGDGLVLDKAAREHTTRLAVRSCVLARNAGAGAYVRGAASITDNLVFVNQGPGLDLVLTEAEGDSVVRNTLFANGGAGLRLGVDSEIGSSQSWIENNLAVENRDRGLVLHAAFEGTAQHNDAWRNENGDYAGFDLDVNLVADPLFCDAKSDNLYLAANSLCAPGGPYGQIGALGVGCPAKPVAGGPNDVLLALSGISPNPARAGADVTLALSLPAAHPTSLDLLDATGRRVISRDLGTPGAGDHRLKLSFDQPLPPGIYWVRVVQGGRSAAGKVTVLP